MKMKISIPMKSGFLLLFNEKRNQLQSSLDGFPLFSHHSRKPELHKNSTTYMIIVRYWSGWCSAFYMNHILPSNTNHSNVSSMLMQVLLLVLD